MDLNIIYDERNGRIFSPSYPLSMYKCKARNNAERGGWS